MQLLPLWDYVCEFSREENKQTQRKARLSSALLGLGRHCLTETSQLRNVLKRHKMQTLNLNLNRHLMQASEKTSSSSSQMCHLNCLEDKLHNCFSD